MAGTSADGGDDGEMVVAKAMIRAVPKVLGQALMYPPIALMLGFTLLMTYGDQAGVLSSHGRLRTVLALASLPLFGSAGLLVVRDYLMVPLFFLPAILIGKVPQVAQWKATGLAQIAATLPCT
jgi:hypothetical protein